MELIEAIKTRKSIRGYKKDPVPKAVLREVLEIASRAPSSENTQPWEFLVVGGDVLDKIRQANVAKFNAHENSPPDVQRGPYLGKHRQRMVAIGIQLFQLMGIGKEDREKKIEWGQRNYKFFDAPATILIVVEKDAMEIDQLAIGALAQTIALVALNYGLGTCIAANAVAYAETIRKFAGIPDTKRISMCLTIGYLDSGFPANKVQSEREPVDSVTTWIGI